MHAGESHELDRKIETGLERRLELLVAEQHTAPRVGSGRVHVLATPVMINVIEAAALAAIEHLLPQGYQSLGTRLDIRHFAATPVGMRVRAEVEVEKVEGRSRDVSRLGRRREGADRRRHARAHGRQRRRASTFAFRTRLRWCAGEPEAGRADGL